jgi:Na+/H+ antiporter NhaA
MQKIATQVFIYTSVAFGIIGLIFVFTIPGRNQQNSDLNILLIRLLMTCVFIILPSFALSVAGKYLDGKK